MTTSHVERTAPGRAACRALADDAAARRREIPDRRPVERRVDAEHRRGRRQAADALDRRLADPVPDGWITGHGAYVPVPAARSLERVVADQRFADAARAHLADALRAVDWADAAEVLRRVEATTEVLRRHIDTKEVARS